MALYSIIDFAVQCKTELGQKVVIVGDQADLGSWDESKGIELKTDKESYPVWSTSKPWLLKVPAMHDEAEIQFKIAIVSNSDEEDVVFEEISTNRRIVVSGGAAGMAHTIKASFGKAEAEPTRLPQAAAKGSAAPPKFAPPARSAGKQMERPEAASPISDKGSAQGSPSIRHSDSGNSIRRNESGNGLDYMMQAETEQGQAVSFWHDIPLFPLNEAGKAEPYQAAFVCEIPKATRKKFEVCTKGVGNPIKQDTKNGKLREYSKGDIWFNYGCLPRTWEDPEFVHPDVGFGGDGDPLDACEIGLRSFPTGTVRQTKVLGVICMIDEEEADWKLIVIDTEDRWADELNNIDDVERLLPGSLDQIREWWRTYKITDGKPENKFGLDEKFLDRDYAMKVILECHEAWKHACQKVEKGKSPKKNLSFSKLADLDVSTDVAALENLVGA